uniref:Zinc transporter protein n=1 Tax=Sedum alfredii TaxID=439688 RepID=C0L438_9MAGN|nr:zinc transporter protein [Sedum alfredii]
MHQSQSHFNVGNGNSLRAGTLTLITPIILLLPAHTLAKCTCDGPEDISSSSKDKAVALKYKIVAVVTILIGGVIGICFPVFSHKIPQLSPETNVFFMIKAFAAGVILSTGFIHVLPEAFKRLMSPCLSETPWDKFPFTGFVAMVATMLTLMIDAFATPFYTRKSNATTKLQVVGVDEEEQGSHMQQAHTHTAHGHSHGSADQGTGASDLLRQRVISQVLELGIVVHSVIIGVSLGASNDLATIKPLLAALTFHQFFEGLGLGGCIAQAKFKARTIATMVLFFSLTAPIGIAIGIGVSSTYKENSSKELILPGLFDAASAGILIYTALVDLLAADFMGQRLQSNGMLQIGASISLFIGAGCMSLLAIWA